MESQTSLLCKIKQRHKCSQLAQLRCNKDPQLRRIGEEAIRIPRKLRLLKKKINEDIARLVNLRRKFRANPNGHWVVYEYGDELQWARIVKNSPKRSTCRIFTLEDRVISCPNNHVFLSAEAARDLFPTAPFYDYEGMLEPKPLPDGFVYDVNRCDEMQLNVCKVTASDIVDPCDKVSNLNKVCWPEVLAIEETPDDDTAEICRPEGVWVVCYCPEKSELCWGLLIANSPNLRRCIVEIHSGIISVPNQNVFFSPDLARIKHSEATFGRREEFEPNNLPTAFSYDVDIFGELWLESQEKPNTA